MTRRESSAAKARQTIRQRLLARLPSTAQAIPRAYRSHLLTLASEGIITYDKGSMEWRRAQPPTREAFTAQQRTEAQQSRARGSSDTRAGQANCGCYYQAQEGTACIHDLALPLPSRVSRATTPSIVDYHPGGSIAVIQDDQETLIFQQHPGEPQWVVRTLTSQIRGGSWTYVDSPHGQALTRVSVNEVAREDRIVDITLTIRVTTSHHDLPAMVALVRDSLDAGPSRPMEFLDGNISALGVAFTINNWSEVPRG